MFSEHALDCHQRLSAGSPVGTIPMGIDGFRSFAVTSAFRLGVLLGQGVSVHCCHP